MGARRDRLDKRLNKAKITRQANSLVKDAERERRKKGMLAILQNGQLPYTPGVMCWLSTELGKKASRVTADDVQTLLA